MRNGTTEKLKNKLAQMLIWIVSSRYHLDYQTVKTNDLYKHGMLQTEAEKKFT